MIAITTKSSISVKPFFVRMTFSHLFQREIMCLNGMLDYNDYNRTSHGDTSCRPLALFSQWLAFYANHPRFPLDILSMDQHVDKRRLIVPVSYLQAGIVAGYLVGLK